MMRRVTIFLVFFLVAYAVTAWASEGAPRTNDWWDLLYALIGAAVGWLTRFLQNRASR